MSMYLPHLLTGAESGLRGDYEDLQIFGYQIKNYEDDKFAGTRKILVCWLGNDNHRTDRALMASPKNNICSQV